MRRSFLKAAVAGAIFIFQSQIVIADDYSNGVTAFEQGDYSLAVSFWLPLAEKGNGKAQYSLGKLYETPDSGGQPSYKEAIKWYQEAAKQGVAAAQNNLGRLFAQGKGIEIDQAKAVDYWQMAAQSNHAMAQYNLGLALFRGDGIERNLEQAVFWFHQSANKSVSGAQYALGEVYRLGLSVPVDLEGAKKWYQAAALSGDQRAEEKLQMIVVALGKTPPQDTDVPTQEMGDEITGVESVSAESSLESTTVEADKTLTGGEVQGVNKDVSSKVVTNIAVTDSPKAQSDTDTKSKKDPGVVLVSDLTFKPQKNPRRFAGIGSLLIPKPKSNPRRR